MPAPASLRPIARRALAAQSDDRLVTLVREGHVPAFEEMVRRYRGPLVGFAAAIVSADGAEDVVQASLEKAHRAILADSREIALRPWLFAIVRNGALNSIRGEPRVDELGEAAATSAGPSEIAEQRDDLDRLVVAMCALPAAQRQALVKRELEGVGHGEIAAQLGTTATAVRGLIFRARVGLRDAVGAAVPLPILRAMLTDAPAVGMVGGGTGAGAAALIGGGGVAKGVSAIAAVVLALGTGIAIEQGRRDQPVKSEEGADVVRRQAPSESSAGATATTGGRGDASTLAGSSDAEDGSSNGGGEGSGSGGGEGPNDQGDDSSSPSDEGTEVERAPEPDDEGPGDDSSGPGSGEGGEDDDPDTGESGNSGPGGGDPDPSEPEDEPDDHGGSGPSPEEDHSGPGRPPDPDEPDDPLELLEPDEPDSGGSNSGPGGGGDEPRD